MADYSCKKFPYVLPVSHNTSVTDGRKDWRQLMPIARPLLKFVG